MAGRGPLQLVVASHMEDAGLEVVALEESASTLGPGVYYKLYLDFYRSGLYRDNQARNIFEVMIFGK
jgi:hypothetical protein